MYITLFSDVLLILMRLQVNFFYLFFNCFYYFLSHLLKYNPSYCVHEPDVFHIQGEQDRVRACMQIHPRCCGWFSTLSLAQQCAQQRKGRRSEKERGRGDILHKDDDKSMTIMELRRWKMSGLQKKDF